MSPRKKNTKNTSNETAKPGTYTRKCLANELAGEFPKIPANMAYEIVQAVIEKIKGAILEGKDVQFRDFGVFKCVTRRARPGRNPRKPDAVVAIPERITIRFKPSRNFKAEINPGKKSAAK